MKRNNMEQKQQIKKVALGQLLELLLHELNTSIEENKAIIELQGIPKEIQGDYSQLRQLFQNLIANAIKFRSEVSPQISIMATENEESYQFSIKDNGIGISKEYQERIFVMFQRLHNRNDYDGSGIGLAICQKIVHRLGGQIWIDSEEGKGAIFHFTILKTFQF